MTHSAQNGSLDHTFGNGGIAPTNIYTDTVFRISTGLILQPDGKILISGNFIARYKANGTPDSNFAANGFFKPAYTKTGTFRYYENAKSMALQPDGKILYIGKPDTGCFFIARLLPSGKPDSSFGQAGIIKYQRIDPWHIKLQVDGKIIVVGGLCGSAGDSAIVGRYLHDGSPDLTFGNGGYVSSDLCIYDGFINGFDILPDGRIVLGGLGYNDSGYRAPVVIRYLSDGKPDTSLGGKGRIFPYIAMYCRDFTALPDGRMLFLVAAGSGGASVNRLNANGSPDTNGFGQDGFTDIPGMSINTLLPLPDGRILCGGLWNSSSSKFAIGRLLADGRAVDSSFGINGLIRLDSTAYGLDGIALLTLQQDQKIVAFGGYGYYPEKK